ncbi:MAG: universal stress protein [Gammaproteobacteria bacterium]|jgi:nucleotide-binding universal stress UspA family protein
MYKHILVAVDGSHISELVLQEAIKLAKAFKSQLRLVHAVDEIGSTLYNPEYTQPGEISETMAKAGREVLDKAAATAAAAGVKTDTKLAEIKTLGRRIPEAIAEEAEAWPADLVVIGTHGRRGLSRMFLGSVAEGTSRVCAKPVLLVRGT